MSGPGTPGAFSAKRVTELLGLSRRVLDGLVAAGFVTPGRGPGQALSFSFQDLVVLRTARTLQEARIPPRRILQALERLRASLPEAVPLSGLRIRAVGDRVVVSGRDAAWEAQSGQLLMDFEVVPEAGRAVAFLQHPAASPSGGATPAAPRDAEGWFAEGERLEPSDRAAAEAAYRQALAADPGHVHAHLNLGALLCEARRCQEATSLYDAALARGVTHPLLHFNRAIALEDQDRPREAIEAYRLALAADPDLHDAHFNLGRLLEQLGDDRGALRHFSAYRRGERGDR